MVKNLWNSYNSKSMSPDEKSVWLKQLTAANDRANVSTKHFLPETGTVLTGIRSAAPAGFIAMQDIAYMSNHFTKKGSVDLDWHGPTKLPHKNPTFLSSPNQALTLHYGLDPLLGFHLATAYIPLAQGSVLHAKDKSTSSPKALVQTARSQFRLWSQSFRRGVTKHLVVRFCAADALAFCHTLQQVSVSNSLGTMHCDNWTFEPLG